MKNTNTETKLLIDTIVESLHERKAIDVIGIDLSEIPDTATEYFIICNGDSSTQVQALADNTINKVREVTREKAWHVEGLDNSQWVLLDYINVVVHIFQPEYRTFYDIEGLWVDATQKKFEDKPIAKK